jgi:hypothetical protein
MPSQAPAFIAEFHARAVLGGTVPSIRAHMMREAAGWSPPGRPV